MSQRTDIRNRAAADRGPLVPVDAAERPAISLVIPTMNEEAGIRECIERAIEAFEELDVTAEILVSDSSTDRTPEIARELGARVVTPDREGYGYAYQYAFERARGDLVAMGDGDTTYDFGELPKLVERLETTDADLVLGSRLDGDIRDGAMPPLHRYVGNPVLTTFLNAFYGAGVSDAHSGLRVFRRELLSALDLGAHGMEFASEMIMQASAAGLTIEEVPITYHERAGEAKLETFGDGWRHVRFMLVNAPSYLFAGPGLGLGILGLVTVLLSLVGVEASGVTFGANTTIAGSALLVVGYQIGTLSVFTTVASDPIKAPEGVVTRFIRSRFTLELGLTLGSAVLLAGGALAVTLVGVWAVGLVARPPVTLGILGLTAVVIGLQTMFNSFFLSILAGLTPRARSLDEPSVRPDANRTELHAYRTEEAD